MSDKQDRSLAGRLTVASLLLLAAAAAAPRTRAAQDTAHGDELRVYVGTYTDGESKGIYRLRLDLTTGRLRAEGEPAETANPSFLALHPSGRYLYAVNELGDKRGDPGGAVSAFAVDPGTGALTFLGQQPSGGAAPCHLWIDSAGRNVLVANYGGGSVATLPIGSDGRLGPATSVILHEGKGANPERQEAPHAHFIRLDATERHALAVDLGLDKVLLYAFDGAKGTLTPREQPAATLAPGAGPRHLAFHPDGRHAYVINEMASTLTAFDYDSASGHLSELQTLSTLPAGFSGENTTAEVEVRPDGKFLYGSNRGHDSIAIFSIDAASGRLTLVGHQPTLGHEPRNFVIDASGRYLLAANQLSDSVVVFRIDAETGRLEAVGEPLHVPRPVCLRLAPASN